jgi:beta-phosphoglucomutase-like phosphatase (HAD superfamily)
MIFVKKRFDVVIIADDVEKGKSDPSSFVVALQEREMEQSRSPSSYTKCFGASKANYAGIEFIVVLNNLVTQNFSLQICDD